MPGMPPPPDQHRPETQAHHSVLAVEWVTTQAPDGTAGSPASADRASDWLATATRLVQAHGGREGAPTATTFTAHFGAAAGPADHADRALRCGLALLAAARRPDAPAGLQDAGAGLQVRAGLHTAAGAFDPTGEAPQPPANSTTHLASCLAAAAPPGRLRISHASATRVRQQFDIEPLTPLTVPGLAAPLQTALLRGDRPRPAEDGARDGTARRPAMVGRQAALAALQDAFRCVRDEHRPIVATVLADAGLGKSRLQQAFDTWVQAQPLTLHLLRCRATPATEGQPFGLLRSLLGSLCQFDDTDTPALARTRLEQVILPWFLPHDDAEQAAGRVRALAHLVGIDQADNGMLPAPHGGPRQGRQQAFDTLATLLRRMVAGGSAPMVLQIEDLHWADNETLDLLDQLVDAQTGTALLVVATSRPALRTRRPTWARREGQHRPIDLAPLTAAEQRQMAVEQLRQLPAIPPALLDLVTRDTAGQPLCIEERIHLLIDQGLIQIGIDRWTVDAARCRSARLPTSLAGVLRARLALLPDAERRSLQQASVIGPELQHSALRALAAGASLALPVLPALLPGALTMSFVSTGADGSRRLGFRHPQLQALTYETVPAAARRAWHGQLARWLLGLTGLQAGALPGLSAHHFEQAGDDDAAALQHARAAEHAASRFASRTVLDHATRRLALLDRLPDTADRQALRWRLLRRRVGAQEILGERDQQRADIDTLATLADALADDAKRTEAASLCCGLLLLTCDFPGLKAMATRAMALAARAGLDEFRLDALRMLADAHCGLGDWDAGHRLAQQCLAQARTLELHSTVANCLNILAGVAERQQDLIAQVGWHEQALAISRQLGDRRGENTQLINLGGAWLALGDLVRSRHCADQGLQLARAQAAVLHQSVVQCHLSTLEHWLGNHGQALVLAESALQAARAAGGDLWAADALMAVGNAALALGRHDAAEQAFGQSLALRLADDQAQQVDAAAGLGRLALVRGDLAAALEQVQRVLDREAARGVAHEGARPLQVDLFCHRALSIAGDPRADHWLERAHARLMATAATLADETLRQGFLDNIPEHRAIRAAWALRQPRLAGPMPPEPRASFAVFQRSTPQEV